MRLAGVFPVINISYFWYHYYVAVKKFTSNCTKLVPFWLFNNIQIANESSQKK